jgi:hypothetical protein
MNLLSLVTLISKFLENPKASRFALLAVMVILLADISGIKRDMSALTPDHSTALLDAAKGTTAINAHLTTAMREAKASRAYLALFHNGSKSFGGVPFLKYSRTQEVLNAGVREEIGSLQSMPLREIIDWIPVLSAGDCVKQSVEEIQSSGLRVLLEGQGVVQTIVCPVRFPNLQEPVGFVGLDFNSGPTGLSDAAVKELTSRLSQLVASQLAALRQR